MLVPPQRRRHPTLARLLVRALLVPVAVTSGVATFLLVSGAATEADGPVRVESAPGPAVSRPLAEVLLKMERYDCSAEGLGAGEIPGSALVRRPSGQVRVVSFDAGWRVHTEGGPSILVAVCRKPAG